MIDTKRAAAWAALALALVPAASADPAPLHTTRIALAADGEGIATVAARCDACSWDTAGREAVTLSLWLDDRYVAHLPLVRQGRAEYDVLLGPLTAGAHTLRVQVDEEATASGLRGAAAAQIERASVRAIPAGSPEHLAVSLAPYLHVRPNAAGRFTDVPVFMWYEREPSPRGVRYRYSVVFTNEDGGTPTDRLMATWGRTTDIEYIYSAEVDAAGRILADDFQGPDHKVLPFGGARDGRHPLFWVSTDNNMVLDQGRTRLRFAPAPIAFPLVDVSREAVMDAHPWLYAVAAQELVREGKIADDAPPGRGIIPDPRRFVYVEACGTVGDAAVAFEVRAGNAWIRSDRGVAAYKIVRDGCFRAAVPLPAPLGPGDVTGLRVAAYPRPNAGGDAPPAGAVRIDRINTVFMLDEQHRPGAALLRWSDGATIRPGGEPLEIAISPSPARSF